MYTFWLILPKVSTIGSFFTIARFLTIRITPRANVTVTTMGNPSGIAATARLQFQEDVLITDRHTSKVMYTYSNRNQVIG